MILTHRSHFASILYQQLMVSKQGVGFQTVIAHCKQLQPVFPIDSYHLKTAEQMDPFSHSILCNFKVNVVSFCCDSVYKTPVYWLFFPPNFPCNSPMACMNTDKTNFYSKQSNIKLFIFYEWNLFLFLFTITTYWRSFVLSEWRTTHRTGPGCHDWQINMLWWKVVWRNKIGNIKSEQWWSWVQWTTTGLW